MIKIFIFICLVIFSYANDSILLEERLKDLEYDYDKIEQDSTKESLSWINPVRLSYVKNENEYTENEFISVSIDQPVFKFGGIYNAIKYASVNEKYKKLNHKIQKIMMIKDAYKTLINLKTIDINLKKQALLIQNKKIIVQQIKQEFQSGLSSIERLNNEAMELNKLQIGRIDLKSTRDQLLDSFKDISTQDYKIFALPKLELKTKELKLKDNLYIKRSYEQQEKLRYYKNLTITKYLPTVSLTYDYQDDKINDRQTNTRGFKVTMPLNITFWADTQSAKLSYMRARTADKLEQKKQQRYQKRMINKIKLLDEKIETQKVNFKFFEKLYKDIKAQRDAGFKSTDDVTILENSTKAEQLSLEVFELEKQVDLLELYATYELL
ncbi:MAG: hypothetical protein DRG11_01445 [Epsilonproteobacteria bacterium]|nr:MAG: hypothetical protein DRG11_01445 [Campylobacterota bacterium]